VRVAFLTHYAELYGANRSLLDLIEGLRAYDVQSYVVVPEAGALTEVLSGRGVPFEIIAFDVWMALPEVERGRWGRLLQNLRILPRLTRQLRQWNIDVIYTNSSTIAVAKLPPSGCANQMSGTFGVWRTRFRPEIGLGKETVPVDDVHADAQIAISKAIRSTLLSQRVPRRFT